MKEEIRWPKLSDKLFVESNDGRSSSTYVNISWLKTTRSFNDILIANAFRESADKIIDELDKGNYNRHPDKFFMPILYLYRHAIELRLKSIIRLGLELSLMQENDKIETIMKKHNLHKLWNLTRKVLSEYWTEVPEEDLNAVESFILQIHDVDSSGQTLRYSINTNGSSSIHKMPNHTDLLYLKDVLEGLFNFLIGCDDGLYHALNA